MIGPGDEYWAQRVWGGGGRGQGWSEGEGKGGVVVEIWDGGVGRAI